jgi:hypothetical protein
MPYSVVSDKSKKTYYLHSKTVTLKNTGKQQTIYFFSVKPEGAIEMPDGYQVVQNQRSGLPFLKRANKM